MGSDKTDSDRSFRFWSNQVLSKVTSCLGFALAGEPNAGPDQRAQELSRTEEWDSELNSGQNGHICLKGLFWHFCCIFGPIPQFSKSSHHQIQNYNQTLMYARGMNNFLKKNLNLALFSSMQIEVSSFSLRFFVLVVFFPVPQRARFFTQKICPQPHDSVCFHKAKSLTPPPCHWRPSSCCLTWPPVKLVP